MSVVADRIRFESAEWGPARIDPVNLDLLADFTRLSAEECLERLSSYTLEEMAGAWRAANPKTAAEISRFYGETDLYLWELLAWNGSAAYEPYLRRIERLADLYPPAEHPRALDYGCGIGTAAVRLAQLGYSVTIADIPGTTLEFARTRLARRGIDVDVIELGDEVPTLPNASWDVVVCFDVLEHAVDPVGVARALVRALRMNGGAAVVASFGGNAELPLHLTPGVRRFGGHRWGLYFQTLGMRWLGDDIYQRIGWRGALARRIRYAFWRATGLYVERLKR
jgi:2-polyprenyl-3-methyl-5-hydroxy-6-metoxy-1,4-benzoquinol methylase